MEQIPSGAKTRYYEKKTVVEAATVVPTIIAAGVAFATALSGPSKNVTTIAWLGVAVAWLVGASILRIVHAYMQDKKEKRLKEFDGLLGAMHVLYGCISKHLKLNEEDSESLRVTLHRVIFDEKTNEPKELEQLLPYIGGAGGNSGRKFSVSTGIIGHVARTGKPRMATRENTDHELYIQELQEKWNYTERTARQLTSSRNAWMAIPILNKNGAALAVVFLDSKDKEAFTEPVLELVLNCCAGIATYITEHYSINVRSAVKVPTSTGLAAVETVVNESTEGATLKEKRVELTKDGQSSLISAATSIASPSVT